jgi:predicted aspartyl protease
MVVTRIHVGTGTRDVFGMLDSGADKVSIPKNIADAFQIPYDSDQTVNLDTSSGTASANVCTVQMEVLGLTEPSNPLSCEALIVPSNLDFILLGRSPWFEKYQIGFNSTSGVSLFALSPPSST